MGVLIGGRIPRVADNLVQLLEACGILTWGKGLIGLTAPAYPSGLTEREVEVLRLIAANLEIAEELVIAEGTARRHVANIYEKIGAANRVEAASYAAREGLMPLDGQNYPD